MKNYLVVIVIKVDDISFHAFLTTDDFSHVIRLKALFSKLNDSRLSVRILHCVTDDESINKAVFLSSPGYFYFDSGSQQIGLAGYYVNTSKNNGNIQVNEEWGNELDEILSAMNQLS